MLISIDKNLAENNILRKYIYDNVNDRDLNHKMLHYHDILLENCLNYKFGNIHEENWMTKIRKIKVMKILQYFRDEPN